VHFLFGVCTFTRYIFSKGIGVWPALSRQKLLLYNSVYILDKVKEIVYNKTNWLVIYRFERNDHIMPRTAKENLHKNEIRKEHIIEAALLLFSEKGFENTRVDEIAERAGVNKALIYYHFESKEALLNHLLEELFAGIKIRAMDFVSNNFIKALQEGDMDILPDRIRFVSDSAMAVFMKESRLYYEGVLDYLLDNRDAVRLMLAQSLKHGNDPISLFRFFEFMEQKESNPMYQTIREADDDFTYSSDIMITKFFYGILPMLNMAAYFNDYVKASFMSEETLRSDFFRICMSIIPYPIQGRDLLMSIGRSDFISDK